MEPRREGPLHRQGAQGQERESPSGLALEKPFKLQDCKDIEECVAKFEAHFLPRVDLCQDFHTLEGHRLVCHCSTGSPCHGDVLIKHFVRQSASAPGKARVLVGGLPHA